jgi:hypothetical protein
MIRKILFFLLIVLVIIQFIHPAKNIAASRSPNDIALRFGVPENVQGILKKSCYDCHSNNTIYPWYNNIQPVAWWLANHINDGKEELNFSEFASYEPKKQYHKLRAAIGEIKEEGMPLNSYLWIHKDAILTSNQRAAITSWADSLSKEIKTKNNLPDEPERRRPD